MVVFFELLSACPQLVACGLRLEAWSLKLGAWGLRLPAHSLLITHYSPCLLLIASKKIPPFYRGEMRSGGVGVLYFFNGSDAWVSWDWTNWFFLGLVLVFH
jgi:hypothetical protein